MKTLRIIAIRKSALIYRKEQIDEVNFGAIKGSAAPTAILRNN